MTAIADIPYTASSQPIDWQAIANAFIEIVVDRYVVRKREELLA
ncbi:MAG: hypothetical protein ACK58Z_19685 [Pseudanabaena sp.]